MHKSAELSRPATEDQFWSDVHRILVDKYRYSARKAEESTAEYRGELRKHDIGDVIFNQGEELVASAIHGLRSGDASE